MHLNEPYVFIFSTCLCVVYSEGDQSSNGNQSNSYSQS